MWLQEANCGLSSSAVCYWFDIWSRFSYVNIRWVLISPKVDTEKVFWVT